MYEEPISMTAVLMSLKANKIRVTRRDAPANNTVAKLSECGNQKEHSYNKANTSADSSLLSKWQMLEVSIGNSISTKSNNPLCGTPLRYGIYNP